MSYCDYPDHYDEKRVKARKHHKCCETGRIIQPGEFYWRCVCIFDGTAKTYKQSESAYHFARFLNGYGTSHFGEDCIPFCGIGEHVSEHHKPLSGDEGDEIWSEWLRVKAGEVTRNTTPPVRREEHA